ncbi:hypothetical protein PV11_00213 [Exophiala sideris]|uniref:Alcohol dehydrogenase-like C-terminal domain-containing protein n=1 Tax=Exophiala sideris TaxID=1016849 RepID=A0A0D1ZCE1_9EURO|nr:hypothetical protein PV11_00213 [Exophiala sideris]
MPHKAIWVNGDATQEIKTVEGGYKPWAEELLLKTTCVGPHFPYRGSRSATGQSSFGEDQARLGYKPFNLRISVVAARLLSLHPYGYEVASHSRAMRSQCKQQHDYLKTLGAHYVFDYRDEDVVAKIKSVIPPGKSSLHAYDCVGVNIAPLEDAVAPGGSIILALPSTRSSPNHHVEMAIAGIIHDLETLKAEEFSFHGGEPHDHKGALRLSALMAWKMEHVGKKYKPARVRHLSGQGMYDAFEAFELMRANKINAEKVVWRMSGTPGL